MDILLQNICQSISTDLGFKKTKQSILPYIELMKELGILESTDNPLKPYNIVKTKEEITNSLSKTICRMYQQKPLRNI